MERLEREYVIVTVQKNEIKPIDFSVITHYKGYFSKFNIINPDKEERLPRLAKIFSFTKRVDKFQVMKDLTIAKFEIDDFVGLL